MPLFNENKKGLKITSNYQKWKKNNPWLDFSFKIPPLKFSKKKFSSLWWKWHHAWHQVKIPLVSFNIFNFKIEIELNHDLPKFYFRIKRVKFELGTHDLPNLIHLIFIILTYYYLTFIIIIWISIQKKN